MTIFQNEDKGSCKKSLDLSIILQRDSLRVIELYGKDTVASEYAKKVLEYLEQNRSNL